MLGFLLYLLNVFGWQLLNPIEEIRGFRTARTVCAFMTVSQFRALVRINPLL